MIGNLFGLLAIGYLFLLFVVSFFWVALYRFYVLPYLGRRGYPHKAAYRRITEYRQICRAEKLLRRESNLAYLAVVLLRKFESISLRNPNKVIFGWVGLAGISFVFVAIGI
jgi:hypothetical protein